jgi:predicted site-specific integrase-resolvase
MPGGEKGSAVYARVSTAKQAEAGNLEQQRLLPLLPCGAAASDVASGRNARRRGLRRVAQAARRA